MSGTQTEPTAAVDIVGVFDNNFNQLFPDARAMTASVKEVVKLMKHPVETGAQIVDHKVVEPIEIRIAMILTPETFVDTYEQIRALKTSNETVQIQTKTGLYSSMVLGALPHKEDAAHYDTITMELTFEEARFAKVSKSGLPKSSVNAGNKNAHTSSDTEATHAKEKTEKSSAAYSLIYGKGKTAEAEGAHHAE